MLRRDFMPRTNDAALEMRKRGLNAVCRNVAVNINAVGVVHGLVYNGNDYALE